MYGGRAPLVIEARVDGGKRRRRGVPLCPVALGCGAAAGGGRSHHSRLRRRVRGGTALPQRTGGVVTNHKRVRAGRATRGWEGRATRGLRARAVHAVGAAHAQRPPQLGWSVGVRHERAAAAVVGWSGRHPLHPPPHAAGRTHNRLRPRVRGGTPLPQLPGRPVTVRP